MNTIGRDYLTAIESYEQVTVEQSSKDPWRLDFHIMPPIGWLNDPNGLCYYKGKYYVYFQYSPFSPQGGMKCWGLYTSTDMLGWSYEGVKLCPDEAFDVHGVYSGSALVEDDAMYLYYTGNVKKKGNYDYIKDGREANTVCVRTTDGIHYEEKQLLMSHDAYGPGLTCHVRDPKVWRQEDTYYMVQGARTKEDTGVILLFQSKNRFDWSLVQSIKSEKSFGYMWECPDLFQIEGQWVLCFSPQGAEPTEHEFRNIYQSGYCFLEGSPIEAYSLSRFQELDRGFDYYAPQSFEAPDGRRIQIGWMGLPDIDGIYENPTVAKGWQHAMTVPRELTIKDGILHQVPIRELQQLRQNPEHVQLTETFSRSIDGCFELYLDFKHSGHAVSLLVDQELSLSFIPEREVFEMRFLGELGAGRTERSVRLGQLENLHMLVDHSSAEVFLNDGSQVFTTRFYPKSPIHEIYINTHEANADIWELRRQDYSK